MRSRLGEQPAHTAQPAEGGDRDRPQRTPRLTPRAARGEARVELHEVSGGYCPEIDRGACRRREQAARPAGIHLVVGVDRLLCEHGEHLDSEPLRKPRKELRPPGGRNETPGHAAGACLEISGWERRAAAGAEIDRFARTARSAGTNRPPQKKAQELSLMGSTEVSRAAWGEHTSQ